MTAQIAQRRRWFRAEDRSVMSIVPEFEYVDRATQSIRYLEHGWPTNLCRWHSHKEYELHLITAAGSLTRGALSRPRRARSRPLSGTISVSFKRDRCSSPGRIYRTIGSRMKLPTPNQSKSATCWFSSDRRA